jgi:hypothetical protein
MIRNRCTERSALLFSHTRSKRKKMYRPVVVALEDRLTPTATITGGMGGINNTGWYPANAGVAVGPSYVMEIINESVAIYNKSTGALVSSESLPSFFGGFDSGGPYGMFDPSVLYDSASGHFVLDCQDDDSGISKSYVDIAVSNSSDPTKGFSAQQDEVDQAGQYWADNGKLGWNADAYVYSGNAYTFSGGWSHTDILVINKSNLSSNFVTRSNPFAMIPARMTGSSSGGPMWFVSTNWSGGSSLDAVCMTNVLSSSPTFTDNTLSVNSYSDPGSAPQPGGTLTIADSRTLAVEWNNNYLVAGFNSSVGSDAAAAWVEISTSGSSPQLVQQGTIHPGTGVDTYFPAVSVDSSGDLGVVYNESSSSEYVSLYITGRLASDPKNTLEPASLAKAGNAALNPGRAGDNNGIALDPSSSNTFWAVAEYGENGQTCDWGTWISEFTIATNPNAQPPWIVNPASASPNPVTGKTTNLSVLANDQSGQSSLTYTWSVTSEPSGATTPTFSVNGTNAAQNSVATFYASGSYSILVTVTDPNGLTVTSSTSVSVKQTATSVSDSPGSVMLADGSTQQFGATELDQFGFAMASQPSFSWSIKTGGVGTVNSSGMYSAPSAGNGTATVTATVGSFTGTASVTVQSVPAAPSNLTAQTQGPHHIVLNWTNNANNQTGFEIERSNNNGSTWIEIGTVGASVTTYTDSVNTKNNTYWYRVCAYNAAGLSAWSNVASA